MARRLTAAEFLGRLGLLAAGVAGLAVPRTGRAQQPDSAHIADSLAYDRATQVAYLYNQPAVLRARGPLTIDSGQTVDGNVTVLDAPLAVAGHVTGRVVVVGGDVTLRPGARVDGDLIVAGGSVTGLTAASVGGRVDVHAQRMLYRLDGELMIAERDESGSLVSWFRRWVRRRQTSSARVLVKGGTYNRVEGLPILVGPSVRSNTALGPFRFQALGIYRSADHFEWTSANLGFTANAEMQFGAPRGVAVGVDGFNEVAPVEPWQMRDTEAGLAAFFLHRDYRDFYGRRGARGYVSLRDGSAMSATLSFGAERWDARATRNPFTIFRNNERWRTNPELDAGRFRLAQLDVAYDTRNDVHTPWTGWLIAASVEHGWSHAVTLGETAPDVRAASAVPVPVAWTRGFVDARRYNRVSPEGQLNLRLVLGGWLGGDPLPLERRFSLGGPGTLPGYDFRERTGDADVLTCGDSIAVPGRPAQCERMALLQVEYRHDLSLRLFGGADLGSWSWGFSHPLQWVVFSDAGRGWLANRAASGGGAQYVGAFPSPGSFRTDVGIGLDADVLGVFVAKSLTKGSDPVNVVVRLRHRF